MIRGGKGVSSCYRSAMTPYYAVIFTAESTGPDPEYDRTAERMYELASAMPGFVGFESAAQGASEITVSYWASLDAIAAWRNHPEHLEAQARGRASWYRRFTIRIARVEREYSFEAPATEG
jgi:heme-degrading monooxygenase HmoA